MSILTSERTEATCETAVEDADHVAHSASASRAGGALLLLLAVLVIRLLWQGRFTAYVRPAMGVPLAVAAGVLAVVGTVMVLRPSASHRTDTSTQPLEHEGAAEDQLTNGHQHTSFPKVAWLLVLPVLVLTVIAPGALGVANAADTAAPVSMPFHPTALRADAAGVVTLTLRDLTGWTTQDRSRRLLHRRIRVVGMVASISDSEREVLVSRYTITCCAADAIPFSAQARLTADTTAAGKGMWVLIVGTWNGGRTRDGWPRLDDASAQPITAPAEPYEL